MQIFRDTDEFERSGIWFISWNPNEDNEHAPSVNTGVNDRDPSGNLVEIDKEFEEALEASNVVMEPDGIIATRKKLKEEVISYIPIF